MERTINEPVSGQIGIRIRISDRDDGSLRVTEPGFEKRLSAVWPGPVSWLRQIHGDRIVVVEPEHIVTGVEADGLFTTLDNTAMGVTTADCAPVVLAASDGQRHALAVVHAGWRGLLLGIVEAAAEMVLAASPEGSLFSFCGPCIGPDSYEFSPADLEPLMDRYGSSIVCRTESGTEGLDLFHGVGAALERSGFPVPSRPPSTAMDQYFSHRTGAGARHTGRMMTIASLEQS